MVLSTISHHRCFITDGSRLNTGCTFPVSLMETMLRFMEHLLIRINSEIIAISFIMLISGTRCIAKLNQIQSAHKVPIHFHDIDLQQENRHYIWIEYCLTGIQVSAVLNALLRYQHCSLCHVVSRKTLIGNGTLRLMYGLVSRRIEFMAHSYLPNKQLPGKST